GGHWYRFIRPVYGFKWGSHFYNGLVYGFGHWATDHNTRGYFAVSDFRLFCRFDWFAIVDVANFFASSTRSGYGPYMVRHYSGQVARARYGDTPRRSKYLCN